MNTGDPAPTVLVVGESLVDVLERGSQTATLPGGSPLNVAVGLARLGHVTGFSTEIGTDPYGLLVRRHLEDSRVQLNWVENTVRTATARARLGSDGVAEYGFDLAWTLCATVLPTNPRILHVGSVGAWLEPGADAVLRALHRKGKGTIGSFDPNIRPGLIRDERKVRRRVAEIGARVEIVKLSREDADWLHPGMSTEQVVDHYLTLGVGLVVVTLGQAGSVLASPTDRITLPAGRTSVVDTVGAGDAYTAGMLHALLDAGYLSAVRHRTLTGNQLSCLGRIAALCARIVVSRSGADSPYLTELRASIQADPSVGAGPKEFFKAVAEQQIPTAEQR